MLTILYLLTSCCTDPKIVYVDPDLSFYPNQVEQISLGEDSYVNEYRLTIQDIRWRKRDYFIQWKLGIITEEKYNDRIQALDDFLEFVERQFKQYEESLLLD